MTRTNASAAPRPAPEAGEPARIMLDETAIRIGYRVSYLANFYSGPIYRELEATDGLSRPDVIVIVCLAHCRSLTAQDISNMTGRPKNSLSRAVHKLLARGLITRIAAPQDPRQAQLDLTPAGRATFDAFMPRFIEREARMLAPLTAAERREFDRLLGKLVHRADAWAQG
jgi:MarR family transcriptional regulator, temperature-dependent positive regulator of motility